MGLPIFREPAEPDSQEAATRLERAVGVRRSTIRREPTVRPTRSPRAQSSRLQALRESSERVLRRSRMLLERDQRQMERLEAELESLRQSTTRSRMRLEADENFARHRFSNENESHPPENDDFATDVPQTRSSPPEVHAAGYRNRSTGPRRYMLNRRSWMPSPPYSQESEGLGRLSPDNRPVFAEERPAEPTPNLAPAHVSLNRTIQRSDRMHHVVAENGPDADGDTSALETPPPEEWESSYAPLRRVSHVSPRPPPPVLDGLGDRQRSPDLLDRILASGRTEEEVEDEHWEHLLATNPDLLPSASTSFDYVSRSDSAPRSNRSSQTATTSFGEIGQLDDSCDLDLPPGIDEETARHLRDVHQVRDRYSSGVEQEEMRRYQDSYITRLRRAAVGFGGDPTGEVGRRRRRLLDIEAGNAESTRQHY